MGKKTTCYGPPYGCMYPLSISCPPYKAPSILTHIPGSSAQLLLLGLPVLPAGRSSCVWKVWWGRGDVPVGYGVVARGDMRELCCLCLHGDGCGGQSAHWNGSRLVQWWRKVLFWAGRRRGWKVNITWHQILLWQALAWLWKGGWACSPGAVLCASIILVYFIRLSIFLIIKIAYMYVKAP